MTGNLRRHSEPDTGPVGALRCESCGSYYSGTRCENCPHVLPALTDEQESAIREALRPGRSVEPKPRDNWMRQEWRVCVDYGEGGIQHLEASDRYDAQRKMDDYPAIYEKATKHNPDPRPVVGMWIETRLLTDWGRFNDEAPLEGK